MCPIWPQHQPIVELDATKSRYKRTLTGIRHIGSDVAPLPAGAACDSSSDPVPNARWCRGGVLQKHTISRVADHAGVEVSYGTIKDGVGSGKGCGMAAFPGGKCQEMGLGPCWFGHPPETAYCPHSESATAKQIRWVVEAVQIINAALPPDWKLAISDKPFNDSRNVPLQMEETGEMLVRFDVGGSMYWPGTERDRNNNFVHKGGIVWFDPNPWPYGRATLFGYTDDLDYEQTAVGHPCSRDGSLNGLPRSPGHGFDP